MGEERAVVRECLGVLLTTTQLPSAARSVVVNVETVCKIAEAVDEKKPCISKNMTVRGKLNGGNEAHVFFDVPVGVSVGEMIEKPAESTENMARSSWVELSQESLLH